jgi:hypothetical protein
MSLHDRICETVAADAQKIIMVEGPTEIASWFFPHEPEEDERRIALRTAIEEQLDKRIAEALANSAGEKDRK